MAPDNEGAYLSEGLVCFACRAREGEAKAFRDDGNTAGMYFTLQRLR